MEYPFFIWTLKYENVLEVGNLFFERGDGRGEFGVGSGEF
jgi:hypothetical protein